MHIHVSYKFMDDFVSMAAVYMTGFFMLSGAVLQYMYGDKKILEISVLKNFYWKRFIAIMPLYYFAGFAWMMHYSKESLWQNLVYIPFSLEGFQMLFPGTFNVSHNGGSWFISCIVICYLLYPFMSRIVSQLSIKGNWKLMGIICLNLYLAPLFIYMYQTPGIYSTPAFRFMEFMLGVIVMRLYQQNLSTNKWCKKYLYTWKAFGVEMLLLVGGVSYMVHSQFAINDYAWYNWLVVPVYMLQLLTLLKVKAPILNSKTVQYISACTYAIFLAQFEFCWTLARWVYEIGGIEKNTFRIIIAWASCMLIAVLMHEFIEKPGKKFLKGMIQN